MNKCIILAMAALLVSCGAEQGAIAEKQPKPPTRQAPTEQEQSSQSKLDAVLSQFDSNVRSKQIEQRAREQAMNQSSEQQQDYTIYSAEISRLNSRVIDITSENDLLNEEIDYCYDQLDMIEESLNKDRETSQSKSGTISQADVYVAVTKVKIYDLIVLWNALDQNVIHIDDRERSSELAQAKERIEQELALYGVASEDIQIDDFRLIDMIRGEQ